jgi:hypothetical protein
MPVLGLGETPQDLVQGGVLVNTSQRVEVAFGRPPADLSAAIQVSDAAT